MSFGENSGGNSARPAMMSEINVTPLVDVMLVLLIIFMIAAPMMTQGLDVDLPKVDTQTLQTEQEQTVLTIKVDGQIFLNEHEITSPENLAFQVKQVMDTKGTKMVFLKADKDAAYGHVAEVMGQLRKAGITNIGMVTEQLDTRTPGEPQSPTAAVPMGAAVPPPQQPAAQPR